MYGGLTTEEKQAIILEEAKEKAKALKKEWQEEIEKHRKTGNYKFEITPGDLSNAFALGVRFILDHPKISNVYW